MGAGGSLIFSQSRQLNFSRTVCRTNHRRGITSRVSVTASPTFDSLVPPQQGQDVGAGITTRWRGRCSGSGRRAGFCRRWPATGVRPSLLGFGRHLVLGGGGLELGQLQLELVQQPLARSLVWPNASRRALASKSLRRWISSEAADTMASACRRAFHWARITAWRGEVGRQDGRLVVHSHETSTTQLRLEGLKSIVSKTIVGLPARSGCQARCGIRQSIPASR